MGKKDKRDKKLKNKQNDPFESKSTSTKSKSRGKGRIKHDKNWDQYFNAFQDSLLSKGIFMRDVESDGNCLFRSIADFLDGDESVHEKYRDMAVDYISKNKEYFALFLPEDENINDYIRSMLEDGTWGGHFELVALSSLLGVRFCLHMKDKDPVIVKSSEKVFKNMKTVHLAYHPGEHYSSVRRIGDTDKAPAEAIRLDLLDESSDGESTEGSDKELAYIIEEIEEMEAVKSEKVKKDVHQEHSEQLKKSVDWFGEEEHRGKSKKQKNKKR